MYQEATELKTCQVVLFEIMTKSIDPETATSPRFDNSYKFGRFIVSITLFAF